MSNTKLSAGDAIEARCTKCRTNRKHFIIAISNDVPDKVQCDICEHQHKFKPAVAPKATVRKASVKKEETRRKGNDSDRKEWEALHQSMAGDKAQEYSMTATYKVKTIIDHPVFGLGQVQRVVGPQKIEVLFESGKKIMRCK